MQFEGALAVMEKNDSAKTETAAIENAANAETAETFKDAKTAGSAADDKTVQSLENRCNVAQMSKYLPGSDKISYADVKRKSSNPHRLRIIIVLSVLASLLPYGLGRWIGIAHSDRLGNFLSGFDTRGIALVSWGVTVAGLLSLWIMILEPRSYFWPSMFITCLACEQFFAGAGMLKNEFWYSTNVVYGENDRYVNALNWGITAAIFAVFAFAILYVLALIFVKKDSPLNILTRSWMTSIIFLSVEAITFALLCFSNIL